jgi:hypothetical protein
VAFLGGGPAVGGFFVWGCDIFEFLLSILRWSHLIQEHIYKRCFYDKMSYSPIVE